MNKLNKKGFAFMTLFLNPFVLGYLGIGVIYAIYTMIGNGIKFTLFSFFNTFIPTIFLWLPVLVKWMVTT